ncbi:hypothetical protein CEXT_73251 [Caerostris extrusa]|uniref:Uncharacterized protein n=1 Tax=Caerostris extrusa TaxID=172846 RepID=A0AAV4XKS1_CAEEX|nr:hypothetical protein CEXT_73251 [Caerostris extrusa]
MTNGRKDRFSLKQGDPYIYEESPSHPRAARPPTLMSPEIIHRPFVSIPTEERRPPHIPRLSNRGKGVEGEPKE